MSDTSANQDRDLLAAEYVLGNDHVVLIVPRANLSPIVADSEEASTRLIPGGTEALRLLRGYLAALFDSADIDDRTLRQLVGCHVCDLVAMAVGATRDGNAIALGRGVRAARLNAIKADILENLSSSALTVARIAQRQRVTPRYVHMLFETEGMTFSQFVIEERLKLVYGRLTDRRRLSWTISAIATDAGFGDLSHFNRGFKRRYGASPSAIRAEPRPFALN